MGAHTAWIDVESAVAEIIDLNYSFSRSTDPEKGYPTKVVRNGYISATIRSSSSEMKGKILNWMRDNKPKSGTITIFAGDKDEGTEFKKIEFENAFVVGYRESFNSHSVTDNTLESFDITAEKVDVTGLKKPFEMKWPDS